MEGRGPNKYQASATDAERTAMRDAASMAGLNVTPPPKLYPSPSFPSSLPPSPLFVHLIQH